MKMLVRITWDKKDIIDQWDTGVILAPKYYSAFATAAHIVTCGGGRAEHFESRKTLANKNLFVGSRGGLSVE
jgi:hypothetical protein